MPPLSDLYRTIRLETMERLRDVSVQAERVYLRLACGRFSSRTGLVRYRMVDLAAECRLRPSEVTRALDELAGAGLLLVSRSEPACYLLGFCSRFAPLSPSNRSDWLGDVAAFCCVDLASQARMEIEGRQPTGGGTGRPPATPPGTRRGGLQDQEAGSGSRKQEQDHPSGGAPPASGATPDLFGQSKDKPAREKRQRSLAQNPPTFAETRDAMLAANCPTYCADDIASACLDYWTGQGFHRKTGPIKDWPATCRTWLREQCNRNPGLRRAMQPVRAPGHEVEDDRPIPF